ncbi:MAG: TetR/AcrR family transcriptional regulator [Chloroflexi bacterium]|nr:TetR/AcrR family transcriptional regulator [Chloroflexota bacterium]
MTELSMRRTPQQTRSQQRVDLILNVSADLFAEIGYGAVTTNAIAERAGVSIGSLYRYFLDKDAILRALSNRHYEQVQVLFDDVCTKDTVYLPLAVLIDRLIDAFVDLHLECPAYKQILLGSDVSADIAAASESLDQEIIERMAGVLILTAPNLGEQQAHLVATVCKAQVKALLAMITPSSDQEFQSQIIAEMKRMLVAYLEPIFVESGD